MASLPRKCPRCGKQLPAGSAACPTCPPDQPADVLRPLGGPLPPAPPPPSAAAPPSPPARPAPPPRPPVDEPLPPAPGQEPFGTWASIKSIAHLDPLFGVLLAFLALNLIGNVLRLDSYGIVLSAAVLWGIVTFQWWGYWIAMFCSGVGLLLGGAGLLAALITPDPTLPLAAVLTLATGLFTLIVLYTRRDRFD